jgi:hypothetical protein
VAAALATLPVSLLAHQAKASAVVQRGTGTVQRVVAVAAVQVQSARQHQLALAATAVQARTLAVGLVSRLALLTRLAVAVAAANSVLTRLVLVV